MAVFNRVEFWPSSGHDGQLWTDDPATDALVKSACRVTGAYSAALGEERLEGPHASLRFFSHPHEVEVVQLQVDGGQPVDWESGLVLVPESVAQLSAPDRARLVLDLIHDAVVQLAPRRGWSPGAIERVRARVLSENLEFSWASPWKTSPDRSMAARVVFRVADDGRGRATIEVKDRKADELIARSAPALAYNALVSFRASAKTLRWTARTIQFVPRTGSPHGDVVVSLDPDLGVVEEASPEEHRDSASVAVPPIVRAPYGSHVQDSTPGIDLLMGFGIGLGSGSIPDVVAGTSFEENVERELLERIGSGEAGIGEWLDGLPVEITLEYHLPAQVEGFGDYGIRVRRTKKRLSVVVLRDGTWLAGDDVSDSSVRREVAEVAGQVFAALGARASKSVPR